MIVTEEWRPILGFSDYQISNTGRVFNTRLNREMCTSRNQYGNMKISLVDSITKKRHDRSVAEMVAEAFVEPPNHLCDRVVMVDGDLSNCNAENLVWRTRSYAWKYTRQLKTPQPRHYENLPVLNITQDILYSSIVECGMAEGLLFNHLWIATYNGEGVFPYYNKYEIVA